jgi:hypothetical protein
MKFHADLNYPAIALVWHSTGYFHRSIRKVPATTAKLVLQKVAALNASNWTFKRDASNFLANWHHNPNPNGGGVICSDSEAVEGGCPHTIGDVGFELQPLNSQK